MRSTKTLILLLVAAGCGLIAAIGFANAMSGETAETETIFVAAQAVPSYSKLNSELVKQEEWPRDKIPQGAVRSIEEFEGLSPRYPLVPGEPIVLSKLSSGNSTIAAERIPKGHQVMSVKVDKESALNGLITPGDRVDVLVFIRGRNNGTADAIKTGTRTILRNVTVFAVNDQMARDPDSEGSRIDAKTVTLIVLPAQSEKLLLAKQMGTLHLALRKPGDEEDVDTAGATPRDLLDDATDGSDGTQQASDKDSEDDLFGILKDMQGGNSTAVDTSTAPVAAGGGPSMVIMSPDGVLGTFNFTDEGGLPTELLDGTYEPGGEDNQAEELDDTEPTGEVDFDEEGEVGEGIDEVLDPSALGF